MNEKWMLLVPVALLAFGGLMVAWHCWVHKRHKPPVETITPHMPLERFPKHHLHRDGHA